MQPIQQLLSPSRFMRALYFKPMPFVCESASVPNVQQLKQLLFKPNNSFMLIMYNPKLSHLPYFNGVFGL